VKLRLSRSSFVLLVTLAARGASAAGQADGGLAGLVEDSRGVPVAGAVVSLFGKGVGGAGLVALSDSAGRFVLPSVPAGSYTLRALGAGHIAAPARHITVLPNREASFTVSLTPIGEDKDDAVAQAKAQEEADQDAPSLAELRWLLRHKRRSVLETHGPEAPTSTDDTTTTTTATAPAPPARLLASLVPDLAGTVEVMATPVETDDGLDSPTNYRVLRLNGRIAHAGQWSLGGLVAESESASWRMAAEFVLEPSAGHRLQAGTGYGTRYFRPVAPGGPDRGDNHSVGAAFVQDQWQVAEKVTTTVGGRFSYIGFLRESNHFDPMATLEFRRDAHTRFSATAETRTLAPGGDLLTLSTLATAPAVAYAILDDSLQAERSGRLEMAVAQVYGATTLGAHTFFESVHHQLANAYLGAGASRSLRITDAGDASTRGFGLSMSHRFGGALNGSVCYRYVHSTWEPRSATPAAAALGGDEGDFHDITTRVETSIDGTGTRVVAFYRLVHVSSEGERAPRIPANNRRFDVQLSQGLPFVGRITRADWDFLFAVRNLFYETSEGAVLDEMAVVNPPTRVLGGISVRF
jgi:hypothetical protein